MLGDFVSYLTFRRTDPGCPTEHQWMRCGKLFYGEHNDLSFCRVGIWGVPQGVLNRESGVVEYKAFATAMLKDEQGRELEHQPFISGHMLAVCDQFTKPDGRLALNKHSFGRVTSHENRKTGKPFYIAQWFLIPVVRARGDGMMWFDVALNDE